MRIEAWAGEIAADLVAKVPVGFIRYEEIDGGTARRARQSAVRRGDHRNTEVIVMTVQQGAKNIKMQAQSPVSKAKSLRIKVVDNTKDARPAVNVNVPIGPLVKSGREDRRRLLARNEEAPRPRLGRNQRDDR